MTSNWWLQCVDTGEEYPLRHGLTIGRDAAADIVLESREVSRKHARIVMADGAVGIIDLNSTNGVRVSGHLVPRVRLARGNLVVLGDVTLLVLNDEPAEESTLLGAHMPDASGSMVVDVAANESTTFRAGYAVPSGWTREDHAAFGSETLDLTAEKQLLKNNLKQRRVTPTRARAALMTLNDSRGNSVLLLESHRAPQWRLGRGDEVDIQLTAPTVSTLHATIRVSEQFWFLADEGSTNGTELNGKRVRAATLKPGDQIALGKLRMLFDVVQ